MSEVNSSKPRIEHVGPYIPGSILGKPSAFGMYVHGNVTMSFIEVSMLPLGAVLSGDTLIVSNGLPNNGPNDGIVRTKAEHMAATLRKAGIVPDTGKEYVPEQLVIEREVPLKQLTLFDDPTMPKSTPTNGRIRH